jgi:CheY-like chemotaxis protein/two-component sensor histidine kinase
MEEQLLQVQKMEAVGRLSGGIAHDFNNLLTVISGYSELLLAKLDAQDPVATGLAEIRRASDKAAALTQQLLAFSRKQFMQPRVVDLNSVVSDAERMLRRIIGENVELIAHLEPRLGTVRADPDQIGQVLVNLAVNARDAMPGGGKLILETANREFDEEHLRLHPEAPPGRYVMLAVSDTGVGMDEATKARIFEPFFTTKERGKGTGLGLSTVYGIVAQSGGHVWVYSEPGQGTTFRIYLPRLDQAPEETVASAPDGEARGSETVLLVEDQAEVRELAAGVLREYGYEVLEAASGEQAEQVAASAETPVDAVVTDVVLPGISGRVLAERLTARWPGLSVLYMSGYTDDVVVHHGVLDAGMAFLQKPFAPEVLARKLRELLDRGL